MSLRSNLPDACSLALLLVFPRQSSIFVPDEFLEFPRPALKIARVACVFHCFCATTCANVDPAILHALFENPALRSWLCASPCFGFATVLPHCSSAALLPCRSSYI